MSNGICSIIVNIKAEQKREMEKRKNNLVNAISDNNWGEPDSMENAFSIKEILDMSIEGEVQMNLTNTDCVGQNDLCKNGSHGRKSDRELFCVTEKDLDCIDIDDLY